MVNVTKTRPLSTSESLNRGRPTWYADAFAGGTFVHYMLPPSAYHRYHVPVAGRVEESFALSGKVYMEIDKSTDLRHVGSAIARIASDK